MAIQHGSRGLLVALAACHTSMADPPGPARDPDTVMRLHMHQSFDLVRAIEHLLIHGNLEDAKRFASMIATAPDAPAHGPWAARVVAVRDRAAALARVNTVEEGMREVARVGAACGDCHAEVTTELAFERPPPAPADEPTIAARMLRHRWAADRLWEGVVGNADEPWRAGLAVLSASPLELPPERAALARQLQRLADRARRENARIVGRATTYGEILQICASCHAATASQGDRP